MMRPLFCLLALALLSASAPTLAQKVEKPVETAYVLGADDVLEVSITNHPELNRTIMILPDGKITFPEVGELMAAGKTTNELGSEIKKGLDRVRNNVVVSVLVKEIKSRRVRIVGAVKSQGAFELRRPLKLMDVVSLAGGFTNKPQKVRGRLSRGTETILLDITKAGENPGSEANLVLEPDDIILVDEIEPVYVFVAGQVDRPGRFELEPNTTLLSLLLSAGIKDDAAVSKIHVQRGTVPIQLSGLRDAIRAGKPTEELLKFQLMPGDQVFVPQMEARYSVMGMVGKPGQFPLPETKEVTVLEALQLAGSDIPGQADSSKAGIIRLKDGAPTLIPVNFDNMLKKRDLSQNHALKSGDILYVPPKGKKGFQWGDLLSPLTALGVLGFRVWR